MNPNNNVPNRNEIKESDRWDLTIVYPDDGSWEADFEKLSKRVPELEKFKGKIIRSVPKLAECIKTMDETLD